MGMTFTAASSQRVEISSAAYASTQNKNAITFMAWVRPTSIGATNQCVFSSSQNSALGGRVSLVRVGTTGAWRVYARRLDADSGQGLNAGSGATNGVLYHVAGRARFFDGSLDLWINGVQEDTVVVAGWAGNSTQNAPAIAYFLGCLPDETQFYNGYMDDVRLYSRSLTNDEMSKIYFARGRDRIVSGLEQRFLLRERSEGTAATVASSIQDMGITLATGTPTNSPVYAASVVTMGRRKRAV